MSKSFLHRVKTVVTQNIDNEKFGVKELAAEIGISRSQLLRKVQSITGKSANQLIRDLRLEEALKYLKNEDLTASEISFRVGFSSPSYFNKCFHDAFGCTPGEYKKKWQLGSLPQPPAQKPRKSLKFGWALPIGIAMLGFLVFQYLNESKTKSEIPEQYAIAVLPFLDLSEERNMEHLALGLTDAITLELTKLSDLRVISRGSAMMFKDSIKLYNDIAKKLKVNLLMEGSIFYDKDSLRITVQLIEPFPEEKHLWAEKYVEAPSNLITLASNVSENIASEINTVFKPSFKNNEVYSTNPEAYELFLRGRFLLTQQNPRSVSKAIEYLKQSIEKDSLNARAYSSLAEAYISMNKFIRNNEEKLQNRNESKIAITHALNKAIELDGSLSEAWVTLGKMHGKFNWEWEKMKTMAERALEFNNSNANAHILLSDYYLVKGMTQKSIDEARKAFALDPLNPGKACLLAERYMHAKNYEASEKEYNKVLELYPNYGFAWDGLGYVQHLDGDNEAAKESFRRLQLIMGNDSMASYYKRENFSNSVAFFLSKATQESKLYCSNPPVIAMAHLMVNDTSGAMEYLRLAYEYRNEDLPLYMHRPGFSVLHNNSYFKAMAEKIQVSLP